MNLNINIQDNVSPKIRNLMQQYPDFIKSSIKSTAFFCMKEIQTGIKSGSPNGVRYAPFMPLNLRRRLNKVLGKGTSKIPLGKMFRAVKYEMIDDNSAKIGWLSPSAQKLGEKIESGLTRNVSNQVKVIFAMAKMPIDKSKIVIPKRETFAPMLAKLKPQIPKVFSDKFIRKVNRVLT